MTLSLGIAKDSSLVRHFWCLEVHSTSLHHCFECLHCGVEWNLVFYLQPTGTVIVTMWSEDNQDIYIMVPLWSEDNQDNCIRMTWSENEKDSFIRVTLWSEDNQELYVSG